MMSQRRKPLPMVPRRGQSRETSAIRKRKNRRNQSRNVQRQPIVEKHGQTGEKVMVSFHKFSQPGIKSPLKTNKSKWQSRITKLAPPRKPSTNQNLPTPALVRQHQLQRRNRLLLVHPRANQAGHQRAVVVA